MRYLAAVFALAVVSLAANAVPDRAAVEDFYKTHARADFHVSEERLSAANRSVLAQAMYQLYQSDEYHGFYQKASGLIRSTEVASQRCPSADTLAYVDGEGRRGVIKLCPRFFSPKVSDEERAATLYHEPYHVEGPDHVTCTDKDSDAYGKDLCDEKLTDTNHLLAAGGNNQQLQYYLWVYDHPTAAHFDRYLVREHIRALLKNRFNEKPEKLLRLYWR